MITAIPGPGPIRLKIDIVLGVEDEEEYYFSSTSSSSFKLTLGSSSKYRFDKIKIVDAKRKDSNATLILTIQLIFDKDADISSATAPAGLSWDDARNGMGSWNPVSSSKYYQVQLMKDIAMLDQMYELNLKYYKELTMYIIAGKKRLAEVRSGELEELRKKAEASGLAEDAQAYNDYAQKCERFEKKLHDLELTRMVSLQMGPQTRLLQNNDTLMVEKIQSSLVNTIPLWKSQMVLALGMEHSRQATAAQSAVAQTTNELLKKNADMLKMAPSPRPRRPSAASSISRRCSTRTSSSSPHSTRS